MEQLEILSWKSLDAIKKQARTLNTIGKLDTDEYTAIFCSIDEDYFELYYSELENSYLRHFEDEEEMYKYIDIRKNEVGSKNFESGEFPKTEIDYESDLEADYEKYRLREGDDDY